MRLTALAVRDWRNLHDAELSSDARFVVLHGENGQGKTNLLEAVWVLSTLRSFRDPRPRRWVRHGQQFARIRGTVVGGLGTRRLEWRLKGGRRELAVDNTPPTSLRAWFDLVRAVLFVPEHQAIVRGEPTERRIFVDRAAFTARPDYLEVARDYRRVIGQKAALLRSGGANRATLEPWNRRLVQLGAAVAMARYRVVGELQEPFQAMHERIAGHEAGSGRVELEMRSLGGEADGIDEVRSRLEQELDQARVEELRRGRVLVGPHRDDLDIRLDGRSARLYASQGQARSLVLSLKLAELAAAKARGQAPMLLVDDLTSELDRKRMQRFIEVLATLPNQVWLTTTDPAWLGPLPGGESVRWRVRGGQVYGERSPGGRGGSDPAQGPSEAPESSGSPAS